jgi:hypothetical protein
MNNVNILPTERFGVPMKVAGSITNGTADTAWVDAGQFDRLCALLCIATVAGNNSLSLTLRRATDASGTGAETAATLLSDAAATAGNFYAVNYDIDRQKGAEKRFVSIRVTGSAANAVVYALAGLAFDPSFAPASLLNVSGVTVSTAS